MSQPPSNNPYSPPQVPEERAARKVKYFGMFWIGARTYFLLQTGAFVLMAALLAVWLLVPVPPEVSEAVWYKFIPWVLVIGIGAETIETVVMWRKFQSADA